MVVLKEKSKKSRGRNAVVILLIVNAMLALSTSVYAHGDMPSAQEQHQPEPSVLDRSAKDAKEKKKDKAVYEKKSHTRIILKSVLNLTDAELDAKLAANDNNIYKLLKQENKIDEYKAAVLENCKEILDRMVAENKMTRAEADNMYAKATDAMENFSESNFGWGTQVSQEKQDKQNKQNNQDKKKDNTATKNSENTDISDKSEYKEGIGDKFNKWRNRSKDSQNTTNATDATNN